MRDEGVQGKGDKVLEVFSSFFSLKSPSLSNTFVTRLRHN